MTAPPLLATPAMANSKIVICTSLVTLVASALLQPAPAAQIRPRFALTEARLAEAFAEVREDRAPELADILTQRTASISGRRPAMGCS